MPHPVSVERGGNGSRLSTSLKSLLEFHKMIKVYRNRGMYYVSHQGPSDKGIQNTVYSLATCTGITMPGLLTNRYVFVGLSLF